MMSVLSAFLVVVWWVGARRERCRLGWVLLVAGAMVPIAAALWQLATGRGNTDIASLNRLQGTFSHPNTFGPFLVPFILLSIAGLRNASRAARFLRVGVAAGLSLLVVLTYSRTAVLVLITGMIALPMLQAGRFGVRAIISSTTVALVFATVGWLLVGDIVRERFSDLRVGTEALEAARTGEAENSLEWRLLNWGVLVTLGREHPLAGHGAGMTTELNPIVNAETGLPYNAHNDFVRFFVEGGGLGLLAYLIYGLLLARWTLLTARTAGAREAASAYAVAAALLALFFLTLGTPEFGQQTALQYELYGMLALMTAIRGGEREASLAKAGSLSGVEPEFGPMRRLASQHESSPGDHQPDSETDGNRK
jgi:O-antigen ligase